MKRLETIIICFIVLAFASCGNAVEPDVEYTQADTMDSLELIEDQTFDSVEWDWYCFSLAVANIESGMTCDAVSKNGKYVGCFQIGVSMVAHANSILGYTAFCPNDRYDFQGSYAIWNVVQNHDNPSHDKKKALSIWNKHHSKSYEDRIMNMYQYLKATRIE